MSLPKGQIVAPGEATSVYLYYDRLGVLLYVGITGRSTTRQSEHAVKEWWPFVAKQEIEHYETRDVALARETMLIREYRPPFNKQQNPSHREMRDAYLTLFCRARSDALLPECEPTPCADDCLWPAMFSSDGFCGSITCEACHQRYHAWSHGFDDGHLIQSESIQDALDEMMHNPSLRISEAARQLLASILNLADAVNTEMGEQYGSVFFRNFVEPILKKTMSRITVAGSRGV